MPVAACSALLICLALWLIIYRRHRPRLTPYLLTLLFFLLGGVHGTLSLQPPSSATDISILAQQRHEASVIGLLVSAPEIGPERTTLQMEVTGIINGEAEELGPARGRIQLAMADPPPPGLLPGDLFIARATIGPVLSYRVPGAFNYQAHLAYQGIRASGWIRSPALIMEITPLPPPTLIEKIRSLPEVIRYRLSRLLQANLPLQTVGVYQAILLGLQGNISPRDREAFQASGSYHLLSISGLHMALLALCATQLLSWLFKRSTWLLLHLPATKVAALLALLPLSAYAMIAGFDPPVVRSLIMITVFIVALLVDRQWSIGNNIAIAALLLLASNPAQLFTASFQLTFAAVTAIALFAPLVTQLTAQRANADPQENRLLIKSWLGLKKWGLTSLLVSLAATLGTAPILARQFHQISLAGPLATLLIEPFLCLWSLILGLMACVTSGIPYLPHLFLALGSPGITLSISLANLCAHLPGSVIQVPTPGIPAMVGWYGLMLLWAKHRTCSRPLISIGVIVGLGLLATEFLPVARPDHETRLTILDVGQGSALIIEMPDHQVILVDGGRKQTPGRSGFDVGKELIAPYLWHQKIRRLAAVVCSHPDADHYNGIPFILRQFRPQLLWINGHESAEQEYAAMLRLATELTIETKIPAPGMTLYQSEEASLSVLSGGQIPAREREDRPGGKPSSNNQSLVLRLSFGKTSFLLPSDIEYETEEALLAQSEHRTDLQADLLVAPHHGSATSSSEGFLRAVAPRFIAISAGQNQAGNFPAPETLARYRKLGSTIRNTAEQGTLFFHSDGRQVWEGE